LHYAKQEDNSLGTNPITIGMWIGQASSPNHLDDLRKGKYARFSRYLSGDPNNASSSNPFPISYCPWCGCKMVAPGQNNRLISGYERLFDSRGNRDRHIHCINISCCFNHELPISFIDEQLYMTPPTLLFATVDKFAQLRDANTGRMFGCNVDKRRKPDLIIQDELHLISGPLGSLVGMYESMVEEVCTERDNQGNVVRSPKIIASTATTRNTKRLIQQLYVRKVRSFPVSGVRYDDNFFSKALRMEDCKRLYLGLSPTGHSASELEIRSVAAQIVAKERLISKELEATGCDMNDRKQVANYLASNTSPYHLKEDLDDYWTLVLHYNNLKSLGRAHSRIGQEIKSNAESMRKYLHEYPSLSFVSNGFHLRAEEFTSRQESSRIKELLVEAESRTSLTRDDNDRLRVTSRMDVVQATNMISVGIDIERWNTMMMIGQPLTTAEYIQSSSRVGRKRDGLVINLYNPLRLRELSLYENYLPYHEVFYKHVEPLMATTFTEQTVKKLVTNLYLCYMIAVKGYNSNDEVTNADIIVLKDLLRTRAEKTGSSDIFISFLESQVDQVKDDYGDYDFNYNGVKLKFPIMNSLRDIESETYIYYDN
jgi:superfamily II DNA or RNA helicase